MTNHAVHTADCLLEDASVGGTSEQDDDEGQQ